MISIGDVLFGDVLTDRTGDVFGHTHGTFWFGDVLTGHPRQYGLFGESLRLLLPSASVTGHSKTYRHPGTTDLSLMASVNSVNINANIGPGALYINQYIRLAFFLFIWSRKSFDRRFLIELHLSTTRLVQTGDQKLLKAYQ